MLMNYVNLSRSLCYVYICKYLRHNIRPRCDNQWAKVQVLFGRRCDKYLEAEKEYVRD